MKIIILGGSGFLGSNLSDLLSKNNILFNIFDLIKSDSFPKKTIIGDIRSLDELNSIPHSDVIINLAAVHRDDVRPIELYDEVNILGSKNVCEIARKKDIKRIIFTSSVAIYGFAKPNTSENGEINYFNDYGRTKYLAEKEYIKWFNEDPENRSLTIIRPTVIFGEGNRGNVYNLLKQINSGKFVMFGNGKNIKSMAYVKNVAAFLRFSIDMKNGLHIFNYIDKPDLDMNELISSVRKVLFNKGNVGLRLPAFIGIIFGYIADAIAKTVNKSLIISSIRVKKFLGTTQFSSSIDKTGFVPPYSLIKGLEKTLTYEFLDDNNNKITYKTE